MSISPDGVRRTARTLRKQPLFTSVVVLSLALAIALNTTMYSVLDALAHPRIDLRDPGQLYWIRFYGDYKGVVSTEKRDAALASAMHSYEAVTRAEGPGMGGLFEHGQNFFEGTLASVGENFFDVLGPHVLAGRTFIPADVDGGGAPIVLGESAADALFPNGQSAIGEKVSINQQPHVVVGVVTRASNFPYDRTAAWMVVRPRRGMYSRLVRLRRGVSRQAAERDLRAVADRIALAAGEAPRDVAFRFNRAADPEFQVQGIHYALILSVAAVLLVACANLANLQLARGLTRRRDLALRAALGATRRRIVTHLLLESVLLGIGGLLAGLLLTSLSAKVLTATIPSSMGKFVVAPQMSWRVLVFALAAAVACLIMTGLLPSLFVSQADPNGMLKSAAGTGATRRNRRRYALLVCVEVALALALTNSAAVVVRAALHVNEVGFGFDPRPIATGYVSPARDLVRAVDRREAVPYWETLQAITARIRSIDGVADAAATVGIPLRQNAITVDDAGGGREFFAGGYYVKAVAPGYLRTLRRPIIAGRDFLEGERDAAAVIVDRHTANVLWPGADPIGALVKLGDAKSDLPYVRVVGVMGDAPGYSTDLLYRAAGRNLATLGEIIYLPGPLDLRPVGVALGPFSFVARAVSRPEKLAMVIRRSLLGASDYESYRVTSMDASLGLTAGRETARFTGFVFSLFAALAVGLALFGVYGVVAHSVTERRREFGVRIALGASARQIVHAVLRENVIVALAGVALGLLCTKLGERARGGLPTGDPYDVVVFVIMAVSLIAAAFIAALIPAMRATRVDPTESLRND